MKIKQSAAVILFFTFIVIFSTYFSNFYQKDEIGAINNFTVEYVSAGKEEFSEQTVGYSLYKNNTNSTILNVHGEVNTKNTIVIKYGDRTFNTIRKGNTFVANIPWIENIDKITIKSIGKTGKSEIYNMGITDKHVYTNFNSDSANDPGYVLDLIGKNNKGIKWNTCKPIHYTVNLANAPSGAEDFVKQTINEVERQTGIKFTYKGTTSKNLWPEGKKNFKKSALYTDHTITFMWDSRTIFFGAPDESEADYLGYALKGFQQGKKGGHIFSGVIVFNTDFFNSGKVIDKTHKHVLLHELGHVLNLAHTEDSTQVMYGSITTDEISSFDKFQDKDLQGISHVKKIKC